MLSLYSFCSETLRYVTCVVVCRVLTVSVLDLGLSDYSLSGGSDVWSVDSPLGPHRDTGVLLVELGWFGVINRTHRVHP